MNIDLPEPISAYYAAEKLNGEAVARCFTNRAIVKDEGHTYTGLAAIKRWKTDASAKFQYAIEPLTSEQQTGTTVVTSRLTGNFPGSPLTLQFFFRLERGKIASLEIIP
jgi:hypothetical protein